MTTSQLSTPPSPNRRPTSRATKARSAPSSFRLQRVPWPELEPEILANWQQGAHFAIFGPNGVGKSTLSIKLVNLRVEHLDAYAVTFGNKKRDPALSRMLAEGWTRIERWPPDYEQRVTHRILFWPPYPGVSDPRKYRPRFVEALDGIMREGYWTVLFNEARYWTEQMGLRTQLDEMWTGSRSNGITIIAEAQGPTWINTAMREELQWGAFFRPQHRERAKDVADITGHRELYEDLARLGKHEFIIGRLRTDEFYVTKLPPPNQRRVAPQK